MRRGLLLPLAGIALSLALIGCGTAAKRVNDAAVVRTSTTDDASRRIIEHSLRNLAERREADYQLGPGDVIEVSIFEWELSEQTKTATFRVSESGYVSLPVIGDLRVGGKSVREVKREIETQLREGGYIMQPRVSVDVREFRSKRVMVVGAVRDPGVYVLRENVTTLLDVLSLAGGVTEQAGFRVHVIPPRKASAPQRAAFEAEGDTGTLVFDGTEDPSEPIKKEAVTIDLFELLELGNMELNMAVEDGYVIHVPRAERFAVIGHARRPGSFPLNRPTTVLEAVAAAEGLMERQASPRHCTLKRRQDGEEKIIPVNLVAIAEGREPDFHLQPNDVLDIKQTLPKQVFLETLDTLRGLVGIGYTLN